MDAAFRDLTPEQQAETVEHIAQAWREQRSALPPEALAAERRAAVPTTPDTSFAGAARESLSSLSRGLGATARVVGNATGSDTLRGVGETLTGAVPADPNYQPATPELVDAVRRLEVRRALSNLPRAVVENTGSLGATLAGGAMGAAVGGPVGAFAGATTAAAAQNLGQNVEARAANNGRQEPNGEDLLAGGLTTAAQAGLEAFGAVGRGARLVTNPVTRPSGVVARARALAGHSVREGASEVADETVQQIGTSLGTERGLSVDPAEAVAAGLIGAGTRGAMGAPGAVTRGGLESTVRIAHDLARGPLEPEEAASVARVNNLLSNRFDHQSSGRPVTQEDLLNGARTELDGAIDRQLRRMRRDGWLRDDDGDTGGNYQALRAVFETARRHNKNLASGDPTEGDYTPAEGLRAVDAALARVPDTLRENTKALLRDLDTLADAARRKNLVGPFATLGGAAGRVAAVTGGAMHSGPVGALGGLLGSPMAAAAGRRIGGVADRAAGLGLPAPVLSRVAARRALRQAGITEDRSPSALLAENEAILGDRARMRRAALGLSAAPLPATPLDDAMQPPGSLPVRAPSAEMQAVGQPPAAPVESVSGSVTSPAIEVAPSLVQAAEHPASESHGPAVREAGRRVTLRALEAFRAQAAAQESGQVAQPQPTPPRPEESAARVPQRPESIPAGPAPTIPTASETIPPERPRKGALHGWRAYVQNGIGRKGRVATLADIEDAVRSLAEDGTLEQDEAGAMLGEAGRIEDLTLMDEVMDRVAERRGWRMADTPNVQMVSGFAPSAGHYDGIRSPARWESARSSYQDAAGRAVEAGERSGDFDLAELAGMLSVLTDTQMPGNVRKLRVEALIAASPDPVTRARRAAHLRPLVARYGKDGE